MPIPLLAGALIGAGSSFAGSAMNAGAQRDMNRASMAFSREMYARQRADYLEDWNRINEYNSPSAQMKRYQLAGLNPNLIYGQGNSGNAGPVATPDLQAPQFRSPEPGNAISGAGLSLMDAIYNLDIKQAQIDNLKTQNSVLQEEVLLKQAVRKRTLTGDERARFDLGQETLLAQTSADYRREQVRALRTNTDLSIQKDARDAVSQAASVKEAGERTKNLIVERMRMRTQDKKDYLEMKRIVEHITQMQKDGTLKDLEIGLKQLGMSWNDPFWQRIVGRVLTDSDLTNDGRLNIFDIFRNLSGNINRLRNGN